MINTNQFREYFDLGGAQTTFYFFKWDYFGRSGPVGVGSLESRNFLGDTGSKVFEISRLKIAAAPPEISVCKYRPLTALSVTTMHSIGSVLGLLLILSFLAPGCLALALNETIM